MANQQRSLAKDFHSLMKNIKGFSDGQATVTKWDENNLKSFEVTIAPNDGLYKEGEFIFEIELEENYPEFPPTVYAKNAIYHPNIDTIEDSEGTVCLNLLERCEWSEQLSLEDAVQGLLFLLYNPNLEDPLTCQINDCMPEGEFERNVELSIKGGVVNKRYKFPVNARYARLHPEETADDSCSERTKDVDEDDEDSGGNDERKIEEEAKNGEAKDKLINSEGKVVGGDGGQDCKAKDEMIEGDVKDEVKNQDIKSDDDSIARREEMEVEKLEDEKDGNCDCSREDKVKEGEVNDEEKNQEIKSEEDAKKEEDTTEERTEDKEIIMSDLYFGIKLIENVDDDDDDDYEEDCEEEEDEEEEEDFDDESSLTGNIFDLDDDDDDIVTDEDLEKQLNLVEECYSENLRNLASPDGAVCWSKMVYGDENRRNHQDNITNTQAALATLVACLGHGEINVDLDSEPIQSKARPVSVPKPTVTSRFFRALQTRNFRRWLV